MIVEREVKGMTAPNQFEMWEGVFGFGILDMGRVVARGLNGLHAGRARGLSLFSDQVPHVVERRLTQL